MTPKEDDNARLDARARKPQLENGRPLNAAERRQEKLARQVGGQSNFENDPRFLKRIAAARKSIRAGKGVRLEDVK